MRKILIASAILLTNSVYGQSVTNKVSVPICDSIIEITIDVLNNKVAAGEQLQTLDLCITEKTKIGYIRVYNKTVPNDTALANKLRLSIIKEATKK